MVAEAERVRELELLVGRGSSSSDDDARWKRRSQIFGQRRGGGSALVTAMALTIGGMLVSASDASFSPGAWLAGAPNSPILRVSAVTPASSAMAQRGSETCCREVGRADGILRLRGGKAFLCFGGDSAEGEGAKSFLKSILDLDRGGCTLKEGWILRRCWLGPFPYWRRVYVTVGNDGFLNYNAEVRQHYMPCDGSVPLQGCSVEVENSPLDISGACLSLGNVIRVRVSAQGRAQGRGWWLGDFLFTPVGTESTAEEWFAAVSAASNTPCTMMMLKDLDMQGVYRWIGRELVSIRGKLGPGVDADHIRRRFSENLIDGMALSKLTSDDLREMGIHRIGVRAHILESIRIASTRGADLGIRTKQQTPQQLSEKEYAGSADLADDLEEIAGRGGNNVGGEGRSPQKAAGWTQNLLRSFVAPSGDSRATGDAAAADPNMDALEAMVTAAKAGGYERAHTPPSRQASGALRGMIGLRGADGGEGTSQDEGVNATAVVGGDGGEEDGDEMQVRMDGWMFKRSGVLFRRWRRRWFQLEVGGPDGPILKYMREKPLSARYPREKPQKSDMAGRAYSVSIPIFDCTVKGSGREFNLVLGRGAKSRLKKYTLQAQSVEAQKMWVKNIVEATSATATASNSSVPGK